MRQIAPVLVFLFSLFLPTCSSGDLREVPVPTVSDSLDGLNSYRAQVTVLWQSDDGDSSINTETWVEATRDPLAQHLSMIDERGILEWVQVGDTEWACTDEGCIPRTESPQPFGEGFIILWNDQIAEVFESLDYDYLGEETIAEIETLHYAIPSSPAGLFRPPGEEATNAQVEVWVANEGALPAFIVRHTYSFEIAVEGENGEVEYTMNVYDVNAPFTIERPEGAPEALVEEIPLYGSGVNPMGRGSVSFLAQDNPTIVADFYRNELAALGWTLESEETSESFSQLWSKNDWNLTVTITPEDSGCEVNIEMMPR